MTAETYCYSTDEEQFRGEFNTREEALAEARDGRREAVWTAKCKPINIHRFFPDGDSVIEDMHERAYEEVGDVAEDWLECTKDQRIELTDGLLGVIDAWMDKHNLHARFWDVVDIIEHPPVAEDGAVQGQST